MKKIIKNESNIKFMLVLIIVLILILIFAISPVGNFSQSQLYGGNYLRDCETVRDQVHAQSYNEGSSGGQWQLLCPAGKEPISTSITLSAYELNPLAVCDDYSVDQGAWYSGMFATVYFKNCHQQYGFEYELSMTCCTF